MFEERSKGLLEREGKFHFPNELLKTQHLFFLHFAIRSLEPLVRSIRASRICVRVLFYYYARRSTTNLFSETNNSVVLF